MGSKGQFYTYRRPDNASLWRNVCMVGDSDGADVRGQLINRLSVYLA